MIGLALKGLAARKLRTALTATAIVLAVAMVAGTYVLTDQITGAFEDIQSQAVEGVDVVIAPKQEFTSAYSVPPPMDEDLVDRVRRTQGVAAAAGTVAVQGRLVVKGKPVKTFGAPSFVFGASPEPFNPTKTLRGRAPRRAGELSVLQQTAESQDLSLGDRVGLSTPHGVKRMTIVGVFAFGEGGSSLGGTSMVLGQKADVQRLYDRRGKVDGIDAVAEAGTSPAALALSLKRTLPRTLKVQTAQESAEESADEINDSIGGFLTPALLAFAGAALLVGAFLIFNTFSITVTQRRKEFAVLRSLGATRTQVLGSVGVEALLVGALASVVGIGVGLGFARGISALFDVAGFGIPRGDLVLAPRTVILSLAVGIGVTVLAALGPALRATRVPPIAAMSDAPQTVSRRARRARLAATVVTTLVGAALLLQGLFGSGPTNSKLATIGSGAVLVFLALALSARYVVRPLAGAIGYPIARIFSVPGELARENSLRQPARTAVTASALMIGVGLVVFVAVLAAGMKDSFGAKIDQQVKADMLVYSEGYEPIPAATERAAARVPGVAGVSALLFDQMKVNGRKANLLYDSMLSVTPNELRRTYRFDWIDGDDDTLAGLGRNEALVEEQFARAHDISVGDRYRVLTPSGGRATMLAIGIYKDPSLLQGTLVTPATLKAVSTARDPYTLLVAVSPGADAAQVQKGVKRALAPFPTAQVQSRAEYRETIEDRLNQIVYLLYALLAMSVVISLFGIANSLFLSISERTREFGLLRAVGTTGSQIRRVVRYESVITSVIGGLLGVGVGVVFAWLTTRSLDEWDLGFTLPLGQLALVLVLALVVGVLGAVVPARRGARVSVLEAIRYE